MSDALFWTAAYADSVVLAWEQGVQSQIDWQQPMALPVTHSSAARPALAGFNNQIWCVHRGGGSDMRLWYTTYDFDSMWDTDNLLPYNQQSPSAPALTTYNDGFEQKLLCAYQGTDNVLYMTDYSVSQGWSSSVGYSANTTPSGPALAVLGDWIYCAYRGMDDNLYYLWSKTSKQDYGWSTPWPISGNSTSMGPALAAYNNTLWCTYRSKDNDWLYTTYSSDGTYWSHPSSNDYNYNEASDGEPAMTFVPGVNALLNMWRGTGADHGLWFATIPPGAWSTPAQAAGLFSTTGPALTELEYTSDGDTTGVIFCVFRKDE